jgi:hypothetical protein
MKVGKFEVRFFCQRLAPGHVSLSLYGARFSDRSGLPATDSVALGVAVLCWVLSVHLTWRVA